MNKLLLTLIVLMTLPVVSAGDYVYQTVDDGRNITLSKERTSLIEGSCSSINKCRTIVYIEYFKIPDNYIRSEHVYLEAYYGMMVLPQNITLNYSNRYNDTHFAVGAVGDYDPNPSTHTDWMRSRALFYNGSINLVGDLRSEYKEYANFDASDEGYLYDGNTGTGVFYNANNPTTYVTTDPGDDNDNEAQIREIAVYWYRGEQQDVVFTIKNEFGRAIEGAVVNIVRDTDNIDYDNQTTDLSGQVLYEDVNRNYLFNVTVTATGYNVFTGQVNMIDSSYTITLSSSGVGGGSYYEGLFNNISLVTSPTNNPSNVLTNFSIQINSSDNLLEYWGVSSSFNGTNYLSNQSSNGGGTTNIEIDLTNHTGKTILVSYYFKKINTSLYSQNQYFIVGVPNSSSTSITGLDESYGDSFGSAAISVILMIVIILVAGLFSSAGVPGSVTALVTVPILIASAVFGWLDPILTGMSIMIIIGILIIQNKGGL